MSLLTKCFTNIGTGASKQGLNHVCNKWQAFVGAVISPWQEHNQYRGRYIDWRMWRDVKRRRMVKEYAVERVRINSIRRNNILPKDIQDIATEEIQAFPRDSNKTRLISRCAVTSRVKSCQKRWRVSRIVWRDLADYNKLSGVTRSSW